MARDRLWEPAVMEAGQRIAGRYVIAGKLREGGMGQLYVAVCEDTGRRVALKVIERDGSGRDLDGLASLPLEFEVSRTRHPSIVDVFDVGEIEGGGGYVAMELLEGLDLADVLATERALDAPRAVRIGLQLCGALAEAHDCGVVHCDLKPENLFLVQDDEGCERVKVVDFGSARRASPGSREGDSQAEPAGTAVVATRGTPEYMAPEQAERGSLDGAVDIYAVGVILYEMIAGRVPYEGGTTEQVVEMRDRQPARSIRSEMGGRVSEELERVIDRALARAPGDRFSSMRQFAQALASTPEGMLDAPIALVRLKAREGQGR